MRINFFAPVNVLGMGRHAVGLMKAMELRGHEICLIPPFGNVGFTDDIIQRMRDRRTEFSAKHPSIMVFDIDWFAQFSGNPRIGFAVFETDGFTKTQLAAMKSCDHILTPSAWGQRVLRGSGIESHVVHEGYDPSEFKIADPPTMENPFRFVNVGKFEERKGTVQLIRCFADALRDERAELMLHAYNQFDAGALQNIVNQLLRMGFVQTQAAYGMLAFRSADLVIRMTDGPVESTAGLYAMADCGVFPTRGEAWGLPILECLATGVPVLTGNWSGQSEYLGDDYPQELSLSGTVARALDGVWYHGNRGNWMLPDDGDLRKKLQWAYQNSRALRMTEAWKNAVAKYRLYDWDAAAEITEKAVIKCS